MFFRLLLPALAVVGFLLAMNAVRAGEKPLPPAPPVAAPASPPFASYVAGSGIVEASSRNIAVGAAVPGIVEEVFVEAGDVVAAGDELFRIDSRQVRAQLAVQEARVREAEANLARLEALPRPEDVAPLEARVAEATALLEDARARLALWEAVEDPRAIPRDELDRRRYAVTIAEARLADAQASLAAVVAGAWGPDLEIARAELAAARADAERLATELDRLTVRAPVSGEILQMNIRLGEFAAAGPLTTPLLIIGTVEPLHVRVDVDENDAWRVKAGAPATAYLRGNASIETPLRFVRFEPFVVPKRSLTGDSTERVDTRVLQVLYAFDRGDLPIFVGQQMDVYIDAAPVGTAHGGSRPGGPQGVGGRQDVGADSGAGRHPGAAQVAAAEPAL